jgi:hypothetical protein
LITLGLAPYIVNSTHQAEENPIVASPIHKFAHTVVNYTMHTRLHENYS